MNRETPFDFRQATLESLLGHCWTRLAAIHDDPSHPFRTAVLGTAGADGVALRTVVLRRVDPLARLVVCNTDRRTVKIGEIGAGSSIAWLLFDPGSQTQLRLQGAAKVLTTAAQTEPYWAPLPPISYRNFLTARPPGTPVAGWTTDLASNLLTHPEQPGVDDTTRARENFAVIETTIDAIDWVQLDPAGNARAQFRWSGRDWNGTWVVP